MRPTKSFRLVTFAATAALGVAGCTKAELEKSKPAAVVLTISGNPVDADDASITLDATIVDEDGIALLGREVRFRLTPPAGGSAPAEQAVETDETTGVASATFTGVDAAGSWTAVAETGTTTAPVTASEPFTVAPGAPDSLSFALSTQNALDAGEVTTWTATVYDAASNVVPTDVLVRPSGGDAVPIFTQDAIGFETAGTHVVLAQAGALTATDTLTVAPAEASQVITTLTTAVVGELQTLEIRCEERDSYGNDTAANFSTANVEITPAAGSVVETSPNTFEASGWSSVGPRTARCTRAGLFNDDTFSVVSQTATNTVLATATSSLAQPGGTFTVNCKELDPFGAVLPTTGWSVDLTGPDTTVTIDGTADGDATDGIDFVLGGGTSLNDPGAYVFECNAAGITDTEDFLVQDTIGPTIVTADIWPTPGDRRFAPSALLEIRVNATDDGGVRFLELELVSGPGNALSPVLFPTTGDTTDVTDELSCSIDSAAFAPTFSRVVFRVLATDRAGNTSARLVDPLVVDPAAAFPTPAGLTIRTWFEDPTGDFRGVGITSDGTPNGDLFVQRVVSGGTVLDVVRLTGLTSGTGSLATFADAGFPIDTGTGGIVLVPGGFGTPAPFSVFHATNTQIGGVTTAGHATFASGSISDFASDVTFGDLGVNGPRLYYFDVDAAGPEEIWEVAADGTETLFFSSTALTASRGMTYDGASVPPRLLIGTDTGVYAVEDDGTGVGVGSVVNASISGREPLDIHRMDGTICLAGGGFGQVDCFDALTGAFEYAIADDFQTAAGLASRGTNELFILDSQAGSYWRVYKVTGTF